MKLLRIFALAAALPLMTGATVITSGTITLMGIGGNFNFAGSGFSASGGLAGGLFGGFNLPGTVAPPGTTVSVNGTPTDGDAFGGGSATVDGVDFIIPFWGPVNPPTSMFNIAGPPITLNAGPGAYQSTFTFTGNLCGIIVPNPIHSCVVDLPDLTGSGVVVANFGLGSDGFLFFTNAGYNFTVPEPRTWVLVCPGIGALLLLRRLKLKVCQP